MPELSIQIDSAHAVAHALTPTLALRFRVENQPAEERVQSVALTAQVRIDAPLRPYTESEQPGLRDLFGAPARWGRTLKSLLWTHIQTTVPAFEGSAEGELLLPCSFDFNLATTKYLHALEDGVVPLSLLFTGSVFYAGAEGALQIAPLPWTLEARFSLPVAIWKQVIELHYPDTAALWLRRDAFDRLLRFKEARGLASFEEALELLLSAPAVGRSA
jgi:hypothetical protein